MTFRFAPTCVCAAALLAGACNKKEDKGPPTVTLEQLQKAQAGATPITAGGMASAGVAPPERPVNPNADSLPAHRAFTVESPVALAPVADSQEAQPGAAYKKGDQVRFLARVTGFALASGESDFELTWWIADASGRKIVEDKKRVARQFAADQGYSIVLSHKASGLAAGIYSVNVQVVDNKNSYATLNNSAAFAYGEGTEGAVTAGAIEVRDLVVTSQSTQSVAFSLNLVGLLGDATSEVRATVDVSLTPSAGGPARVLPQQRHNGKPNGQGVLPLTVSMSDVPAGGYQLSITATDVATGRTAQAAQPVTVQ